MDAADTTRSPAIDPAASRARSGPVAWPLLLTALGVLGMAAVWVLAALIVDRQCAWIAAVAAADFALLLRMAKAAPGPGRAGVALGATLATIALANWSIASSQIGGAMGLKLLESAQRLGLDHGLTLLGLANGPVEWAWYAVAAIVALWLGR